jgi:fructose-bisphosphate aldolase/2-amino-3,7-dideoxy-D-threo-hept-6-ulosonate synthase
LETSKKMQTPTGKAIRLAHFLNPSDGRGLVVPLDHGLPIGPIRGIVNVNRMLSEILPAKADGVLLTPGQAKACYEHFAKRDSPGLLVRIDWTNLFQTNVQTEGYVPVCSVLDALRLGAVGVVTYLFWGYESGSVRDANIRNIGTTAQDCDSLGVPLVVEAMARGKLLRQSKLDAELAKVPVRMAGELGADIIKTDYTGDIDSFRQVVEASPVPVMIAGGPEMDTPRQVLQTASDAIQAGAIGVFFGRNVFQAPSPMLMTTALRAVIHEGTAVDEAERIALGKSKQMLSGK